MDLSNVKMQKDTLDAVMRNISFDLPGFTISNFHSDLNISQNKVNISGFQLSTAQTAFAIDLEIQYDSWPDLIKDMDKARIDLSLEGRIHPKDLEYFLKDSILNFMSDWPIIQTEISGAFALNKAENQPIKVENG